MLSRIRSHVTYANVMATIALFVALGLGTAWALGRDSVKSKHIVNGQVKGVDVDEDSLSGLVRGNGQLLFGETTLTGNADLDLIVLPGGLGVVKVSGCNPSATVASRSAGVFLHNDTAHDLIVWSDGGVSGPNNNAVVPPTSGKTFGSLIVGGPEANELVHGHVLRPDTGAAADIAVAESTDATECKFSVTAQTNGGSP